MRKITFLIVAAALFATDLVTKDWAFQFAGIPHDRGVIILEDYELSAGETIEVTDPVCGKIYLQGKSSPAKTYWLIEDLAGVQTSVNAGALFGMGQGQGNLFAIISIAVGLVLLFSVFFGKATQSRVLTISFALVLAGILGNLYDRLGLHGLGQLIPVEAEPGTFLVQTQIVRDWILMYIGSYPWPNYNIADVCLVVATGLILIYVLFLDRRNPQPEEDA